MPKELKLECLWLNYLIAVDCKEDVRNKREEPIRDKRSLWVKVKWYFGDGKEVEKLQRGNNWVDR